jgi:uncharacterized protein with von Willebrand factor type A (vWA) domain
MKISSDLDGILNNFVTGSNVGHEAERKEIALMLKNLKVSDPVEHNVNPLFILLINKFLKQKKLTAILKKANEYSEKILNFILRSLEALDAKLNTVILNSEEAYILTLRKMKACIFFDFLSDENCPKRFQLNEYFGNLDNVCTYYQKEIAKERQRVSDCRKAIIKINMKFREEKKLATEKIKLIESEIAVLIAPKKKGLTIKGKIDLKTGKALPYICPEKEKISELVLLKTELTVFVNSDNQKHTIKTEKKIKDAAIRILDLQQEFCDRLEEIYYCLLQIQMGAIAEKFSISAVEELLAKIENIEGLADKYKALICTDFDYGRFWDLSDAELRNVNFDILRNYNELLEKNKSLNKIAEMLGRYRDSEIEYEEYEVQYVEEIDGPIEYGYGKTELIGVTRGNNLNHVLPGEIALLSDAMTEYYFMKKFIDSELQTFEFATTVQYKEKKYYTEIERRPKEQNKGPFILALDTSGSMQGKPEEVAKIIAFAITKIGLSENRPVFLISFSTRIETLELTDLKKNLPEFIRFLSNSFHGGTYPAVAVEEAIRQMKSEKYEKADLLIITDGDFGRLPNETLLAVQEMQLRGNAFHGLIVRNSHYGTHSSQLGFCNNVWTCGNDLNGLEEQIYKSLAA